MSNTYIQENEVRIIEATPLRSITMISTLVQVNDEYYTAEMEVEDQEVLNGTNWYDADQEAVLIPVTDVEHRVLKVRIQGLLNDGKLDQ